MRFKDRSSFDSWIMEGASHYTACAFRGYPKGYETAQAPTMAEAEKLAGDMILDRPVMVYAVRDGMSAHIKNVETRISQNN